MRFALSIQPKSATHPSHSPITKVTDRQVKSSQKENGGKKNPPLINMRLLAVMAAVTRIHLAAAAKAEPAVALPVVLARAAGGQRLAGVQAQLLLLAARAGRRREVVRGAGRVGEELDVGQGEAEARVALAADVGGGFAADRGEARGRGGGAGGAGWGEGAVGWGRAVRKWMPPGLCVRLGKGRLTLGGGRLRCSRWRR
jgi:hypothetical protein